MAISISGKDGLADIAHRGGCEALKSGPRALNRIILQRRMK
jgi:hypothetical protein